METPIASGYQSLDTATLNTFNRAYQFLTGYFADASLEEAELDMRRINAFSSLDLEEGLSALEHLLTAQVSDRVLLDLVLWGANQPLDHPNGETARAWLQEVVEMTRDILENQ